MPTLPFANHSFEFILLISSLLLVFSVLASRISSAFGVPALLLFLGIGMLAGGEGPGGIEFTNYPLSFAIGSICLAIIIFDGGMRTSWKSVRRSLSVGVSLSLFGTIMTGVTTGTFAHYAFDLSWTEGMLLGSIVSSTDAAAVFSTLRARGLSLRGTLKQTLEFEAGSNDPVAVFLTVGVLSFVTSEQAGVASFLLLFFKQAGLGLVLGGLGGRCIRWLNNHVGIEHEGLYSVLLFGLVIGLFSGTTLAGGSGFLAVYVAGLILGNSDLLHKGSIVRFQDGMAWIAQILVFLTLGLLVTPSHLLTVWREGLLLSLFLMFFARPVGVFISTLSSSLGKRDRAFISWVGLRGAAPIILATLPWSVGLPNAEAYFNLVFFVVLTSVMVQGISISQVARRLRVTKPFLGEPMAHLSMGFLPAGSISVEVRVWPDSPAEGQRIVDLGLPAGVLLTSIEREDRYLIPEGNTVLEVGDKIWGLARPNHVAELKETFGETRSIS